LSTAGSVAPKESKHFSHNFKVLIAVSAVLGLGIAIYENVLPLYLTQINISLQSIGWIFAAAALCTYLFRVGAGAWSDRAGPKVAYGLMLMAQGVASLFTPLTHSVIGQGILKCLREPAVRTRETIHSILLYEESDHKFLHVFGRSRGVEFVFQFLGLMLAAAGVTLMASRGVAHPLEILILASAALFFGSSFLFIGGFRATRRPETSGGAITLRDILRPKLNRELWILTVSEFVFNIGLSCSHSFMMPLFFSEKYGVSASVTLFIMALHRLSIALPMFFTARLVGKRLKRVYVIFVFIEGVLIAAPGFIPWLVPAAGIWLLHDFFGAGIWLPAQQALIQKHSDPAVRGKQVGIVLAIGFLGTIAGNVLAGYLAGMKSVDPSTAISLPFIVGGALVAVTAFFVARL
jgi:MFS family permease